MAKPVSRKKHLRLYTEQPPKNPQPPLEVVACLPELLRAFYGATGWRLRYEAQTEGSDLSGQTWSTPVSAGSSSTPGRLTLEMPETPLIASATGSQTRANSPSVASPEFRAARPAPFASGVQPTSHDAARLLARSIADILSELLATRRTLWQREAELAAGVPLVPHREEEKHLAERLQSALKAGAEVVDADAIALYLLDEATTELKLRSAWGLPFDRLTAPARPLQGAVADLEALLGHAVVLDDPQTMQMWNVPEDFPAAVCVPVSTPTMLLGTLWVFGNQRRDFSDRQTNMIELVAGRVASDLEREMLLRAGTDGAALQKQVTAAGRVQRNELPTIAPLLDGWDVAGSTLQANEVGGAFHDWFCLPQGLLAVAVGKSAQQGVAGALTANGVKTAVRAHARYNHQAERILQQANLTLWTGSAGDQHASLFCGLIETATGRVCCSSAGKISVLRFRSGGWQSLSQHCHSLGESAETEFEQFGHELQVGETLVIFTDTLGTDSDGRPLGETRLADVLQGKLNLTAEEVVVLAGDALRGETTTGDRRDASVLVVQRTTA